MDVSGKMTAKKYFIAIVIPQPLFTEIEAVKTELYHSHQLKGGLRSPAHITLHRPFEWKEEKEEWLIEKLHSFSFSTQFNIELKNFAAFEPRVIYVNVIKNENLYELHNELKQFAKKELKLFNEDEDKRGFHPHITVAFRDLKKPKFYELWPQFENMALKGVFDYSGFSLLRLEDKWEEIAFFKQN
jgi:2'-5' RNA ligase